MRLFFFGISSFFLSFFRFFFSSFSRQRHAHNKEGHGESETLEAILFRDFDAKQTLECEGVKREKGSCESEKTNIGLDFVLYVSVRSEKIEATFEEDNPPSAAGCRECLIRTFALAVLLLVGRARVSCGLVGCARRAKLGLAAKHPRTQTKSRSQTIKVFSVRVVFLSLSFFQNTRFLKQTVMCASPLVSCSMDLTKSFPIRRFVLPHVPATRHDTHRSNTNNQTTNGKRHSPHYEATSERKQQRHTQ